MCELWILHMLCGFITIIDYFFSIYIYSIKRICVRRKMSLRMNSALSAVLVAGISLERCNYFDLLVVWFIRPTDFINNREA